MRLEARITVLLSKYPKNVRDAYMKIIQLERVHKTRTARENEEVQKRIEKIIQEATDEI